MIDTAPLGERESYRDIAMVLLVGTLLAVVIALGEALGSF